MKNNYTILTLAILAIMFITLGFQCGSPEFTGAKVQEQNKNFTEAARLYEKEVQKNPANYEAWFRLGRVKGVELRDFEGMNEAFKEAEKGKIFSNDIHTIRYQFWAMHINNGVAYMKHVSADSMEYFDKAIKEYKTSLKIWPDTSLTYHYLVAAYKGKNDIDNMIASLTKIWEMDKDKESYKSVGRIYSQMGLEKKDQFKAENAEQLKLQKDLGEIDKGSYKSDVMSAIGAPDINKKDKKNPKKEEWTYNKYAMTLTFEGERVTSKKMAKPYVFKIDSTKYFEAVNNFNKAVIIFEKIKAVDPKDNENLNLLLQAYYEANRIQEATEAFKLAVVNEPGNKMNHYILGLLHRTVENYNDAISEFNEAVKIDPTFADVYFDIAASYYNWGVKIKKAAQEAGDESMAYKEKFQSALPWLEKVAELKIKAAKDAAAVSKKDVYAELKNEDARIWDTIGTIYALLGQADKATKALDEADKIKKFAK